MANEESKDHQKEENNKDAAVKSDPETLNTTDPQEHMHGPVSSLMNEAADTFESKESEEEAKKKKDSQ